MKPVLVISAIALRSGGTLSVLQDCIRALDTDRYAEWEIVVLCKDKKLIEAPKTNIRFIEFNGTGFYLRRLFYEFYYFKKLSSKLNPSVWLSLHDISPRVDATIQAVYCHNPAPFYRFSWRDLMLDPTFGFFTLLYRYLYSLNIHANDYVVVQQQWLRDQFAHMYDIDPAKIIVAHPRVEYPAIADNRRTEKCIFIYPALPRVFKNIEVIGEATRILRKKA